MIFQITLPCWGIPYFDLHISGKILSGKIQMIKFTSFSYMHHGYPSTFRRIYRRSSTPITLQNPGVLNMNLLWKPWVLNPFWESIEGTLGIQGKELHVLKSWKHRKKINISHGNITYYDMFHGCRSIRRPLGSGLQFTNGEYLKALRPLESRWLASAMSQHVSVVGGTRNLRAKGKTPCYGNGLQLHGPELSRAPDPAIDIWKTVPDRMSEDMSDRLPEKMRDRMSGRMSNDMSDRMPNGMPERISKECQTICQIDILWDCFFVVWTDTCIWTVV